MTSPAFFIALEPHESFACRIADGEVELHEFTCPTSGLAAGDTDDDTGADRADAIHKALATLDYDGSGICLGLPSSQVQSAQVLCDGLPRKGRQAALLYRLEEHLPLDAESLTADFLPPEGGRTLGVAVETQGLRRLLDRLTEVGVEVEAVCPTALLALWQLVEGPEERADFVLLDFPDRIDVFRVEGARPVAWYVAPSQAGEVGRTIQVDLLTHPIEPTSEINLVAGPLPPEFLEAVASETGVACRCVQEESCVTLAGRAAPALLKGKGTGWVNLRRDALAMPDRMRRLRRPVRTAVCLALTLVAVLIAGSWWRAGRYRYETDRTVEGQRAIFRRLYPNTRVPTSIKRWLASEAARLAGLSGTDETMPQRPAALDMLRRAMAGLPDDLRFRVLNLRVEPSEVYLEGQARRHADAETVARGTAGQGFTMEPPRTERFSDGSVGFILVGKPKATVTVPEPEGGTP